MKRILSNFRAAWAVALRRAHLAAGEPFAMLGPEKGKHGRPHYKAMWLAEKSRADALQQRCEALELGKLTQEGGQ